MLAHKLLYLISSRKVIPRVLTTDSSKQETIDLIRKEAWAKEIFEKIKVRTDVYADPEPEWLVSRLRMYI